MIMVSEKRWIAVRRISDEEIGKILDERPGGRKAGRGDSPYTQEYYEVVNGLKREGKE